MNEPEILYKIQNFCPTCNSIVETGVLFTYDYDILETGDLQGKGMTVILGKCLKCNMPFLSEENNQYFEDHSWTNYKVQLFPLPDNEALKNAPEIVINPFKEAQKCLRVQAYEACVIMCRKGIEAICLDKGVTKGTLEVKLEKLKDNHILEDTFYNWSNELRLIGNDGAHSHDKIITKEDAEDAFDFFDALITYLYHLIDKYNKLKTRRNQ